MTTPTLNQTLNRIILNRINEMHTAAPGMIEKYDHKTQKATVKPLIRKVYVDGVVHDMPLIVEVPVVWPRSKTASLTFPLNEGDYVFLIYCERNIDRFLSQGGVQDPDDPRKYDLTDAVAIPGLYPFSEDSLSENNEDVLLIYNDTKVRIKEDNTLEMEVAKDKKVTVAENYEVEIEGFYDISVKGDITIKTEGNTSITTEGDTEIVTTGNTTVNTEGDTEITTTGDTTVNSANVEVNADSDVTVNCTDATINAETVVNGNTTVNGNFANSGTAALSGGGPGIGRIGDSVEVSGSVAITSGSSAGSYPFTATGTITSGSSQATAG